MSVVVVVLAIVFGLFLLLFILSLLLPVTFKFRVVLSPDGFRHEEWVRFPVVPFFLKVPLKRPGKKEKEPEEAKGSATEQGEEPGDQQAEDQPEELAGETNETQPERAGDEQAPEQGLADRVRSVVESAESALATFREVYPKAREAFGYALSGIKIEEFRLKARLGTGDAFEAAMLIGALRSVAGIALSLVSHAGLKFGDRPQVDINPVFDSPYLAIDLRCAVSVVPWRGLRSGLTLLREWRRLKRASGAVVSNAPGWNTRA